jgi:hypothetical protein
MALIAFALLTTGCPRTETKNQVEIYAMTAAPPSAVATVTSTDREHKILITKGAAVAVTSWTSCKGQPVTVLSPANREILDARNVYRGGAANQFVIWGRATGTTSLVVRNDCAEQVYDVTVRD